MDINGVNYEAKPAGYYKSSREDMLKYIPHGVKTSLEFGCGTGEFSALLKERNGVESWAVEIERSSAEDAGKKLDKVINADAVESLGKLPENYFDCIMMFDVLEHLADPFFLLNALKGKLTKNGVMVASIPNVRYYRNFIDFAVWGEWEYKAHGIMDRTHLRFFTYKSIVKMFGRMGFEILMLEGIHPTSSRTFRILNTFLMNGLSDVRYKHFAAVVRPR